MRKLYDPRDPLSIYNILKEREETGLENLPKGAQALGNFQGAIPSRSTPFESIASAYGGYKGVKEGVGGLSEGIQEIGKLFSPAKEATMAGAGTRNWITDFFMKIFGL